MGYDIKFGNGHFTIYGSILLILGLQGFGILYSILVKFNWHWQMGILYFAFFFVMLVFVYIF